MSDIAIDLSGIIALMVFIATAAVLGVCGLISGAVAFVRGRGSKGSVKLQPAFSYFASAFVLGFLNLGLFGILLFFVDSNSNELNKVFDNIVLYGWLPLQPVLWIGAAIISNRLRKTT